MLVLASHTQLTSLLQVEFDLAVLRKPFETGHMFTILKKSLKFAYWKSRHFHLTPDVASRLFTLNAYGVLIITIIIIILKINYR